MKLTSSRKGHSFRSSALATLLATSLAVLPIMQRSAEAASAGALPAAVPLAQQTAPPPAPTPPPQQGPWTQPPGAAPYGYSQTSSPGDIAAATARGTTDADADTSGGLWFLAGCGLGAVGILIAYIVDPTIPPSQIMGKSPDYVMAYTNAYKAAGKSKQARQALYGCLVGTAVIVAVYVVVFVALAHEASVASMTTTYR